MEKEGGAKRSDDGSRDNEKQHGDGCNECKSIDIPRDTDVKHDMLDFCARDACGGRESGGRQVEVAIR